jgi:hypothetical protein
MYFSVLLNVLVLVNELNHGHVEASETRGTTALVY